MSAVAAPGRPGGIRWNRLTNRLSARFGYGTVYSLGVYLATRAAVALGVVTAYLLRRRLSWHGILTRYDAWWYQYIAAHGYGRHLRPQLAHDLYHARYSTWAFYPGYPLTIRGLHELTRLPYADAAFVLALVFSALAVRAMYALGEAFGGQPVARGSAALMAAWPGSAAMNLPYSEGLFIAATAGSLAALLRRRWLVAGLLGAVATGTRAMGLALVVAAVVVAARELWTRRDLRVLAAPALTASGVGAFYAFGWQQTGDTLVWRHAEDLWHQHLDFGAAVVFHLRHDLSRRGTHSVETLLLIVGLGLLALMVAAAVALRGRLQPALIAYAAVAAAMIVGYSQVGPRPRMALAVVPGFVWLARWLPPRLVEMLTVGLASALALTAFLYVGVVVP